MVNRRELFEMWKISKLTESINTGLTILYFIIIWYLNYKILFWISLCLFIVYMFKVVKREIKLEEELGISEYR